MNNELQIEQLDLFDLLNSNKDATKNFAPRKLEGTTTLQLSNFKNRMSESLYHNFRQTAKAIYESYDWTDEQMLSAAELIYPYLGFRTNVQTSGNQVRKAIFVSDLDQRKLSLFGRSNQTYCIPIYFRMVNSEYYRRFLILSDSESLVSHYTDTYYRKDKPFLRYAYLSKAELLGSTYLINAIWDSIEGVNPAKLGFSHSELHDLFKGLIAGNRASNYMFYDYCMQRSTVIKSWQSDIIHDFNMLQEEFGIKLEDRELWDGFNDFKRMIDYVQNFLNNNFVIKVAS